MKYKLVVSLITTVLLASFVAANNQSPRIRESDLGNTPLQAGQLKITIIKLTGGLLSSGIRNVQVQAENPSGSFVTFSPKLLSLVSSDNQQADMLAIQAGQTYWPAVERAIAPGARIRENYALSNRIHLPARLYYDQQLLATITD